VSLEARDSLRGKEKQFLRQQSPVVGPLLVQSVEFCQTTARTYGVRAAGEARCSKRDRLKDMGPCPRPNRRSTQQKNGEKVDRRKKKSDRTFTYPKGGQCRPTQQSSRPVGGGRTNWTESGGNIVDLDTLAAARKEGAKRLSAVV